MNIFRTLGCFAMMLFVGPLLSQETDSLEVIKEYKKARDFIVARKYDQGARILDSLAKNVDKESLKETYFNIRLTKVLIYQNTRQFEKGEAYRKTVLKEMEGQLERPHQLFGWAIMLKAELLNDEGRLMESVPIYKEALAEYAPLTSTKVYQKKGAITNALGIIYARQSYYDVAADYFSQSDHIFSHYVKDPVDIWRVKNNIGNLYYLQSLYGKAAKFYQESIDLKKEYLGEYHPSFIKGYNNISNMYSEMGKMNLALEFEEYAYRISENYSQESEYEKIFRFTSMGVILKRLGRYEDAKVELQLAEAVFKSTSEKYPELRADLDFQWGGFYHETNETEKAIAYFNRVIKLYRDMGQETNQLVPKAILSIANVYADLGQTQNASKEYDNAISLYRTIYGNQYSDLTMAYINKASRLFKPLKQYDQSIEALNNAIDAIPGYNPKDSSNFEKVQDKMLLLKGFSEKALIHKKQYDGTQEIDYAQRSLIYRRLCDALVVDLQENGTYEDHLKMLNRLDRVYDNAVALEHTLYEQTSNLKFLDEAYYFAERGKNVLLRQQLLESEQKQFDLLPKELVQLEERLKNNIAYARSQIYSLNSTDSNQKTDSLKIKFYQDKLFKEKRSLDSLKNVFEQGFPEYFSTRYKEKKITLSDVQNTLNPQAQIIQYITTNEHLFIYSITADDIRFLKLDNKKEIDTQLARFLNMVNNPTSDVETVRKIGQDLFDQLLKPIGPMKENLSIITDDQLSRLPFETLSMKDASNQDRYLLEAYRIQYLNAASDLSEMSITKPMSKIDLLAMATTYSAGVETPIADTMRAGLGPLKFTVEEAKNLSETFGGTALLNEKATEANFRKYAKEKGILHIASHGVVDNSQPLFSRLILEKDPEDSVHDGNLFIHELYNMSLNAQMAVLSACNTARGQLASGEGILNIGRGFFYAGVPAVVMSHWQVDDLSTSILMKYFYENLAEGLEKSKALREAKLRFIAEASPNKKHPFYWGAFISMGNDSPIVRKGPNSMVIIIGLTLVLSVILLLRRRATTTT